MLVSRCNLLIMRNVADRSCRDIKNTHFLCMFGNVFLENRAVYEIMWKLWYSQAGHR